MIMKKVIRLTETDLVRIVNKVIKESGFRAKFEGADYWIDEYGNYVDFDPDLDSVGYYDFEYEPGVDVEEYEDLPDDIRTTLFSQDRYGKEMYNKYKEKYGKFRYSRKKD